MNKPEDTNTPTPKTFVIPEWQREKARQRPKQGKPWLLWTGGLMTVIGILYAAGTLKFFG